MLKLRVSKLPGAWLTSRNSDMRMSARTRTHTLETEFNSVGCAGV